MSKKFGVSIGFLSALFVFAAWYSPVASLVITVVVLAMADEELLKRNVLNTFFYSMFFLVLGLIFGKVSSGYLNILDKLLSWEWLSFFNGDVYAVFSKLNFASYVDKFLGFANLVIMVIYVIIALRGKEVKIPLADTLAKKVMDIV